MSSPFLALNCRDGGTPQARRYVNATASAVGVSFGALDTGTAHANHQGVQSRRLIQFGGDDNTWIGTTGNQIYRTTDAGASWASVKTYTSMHADTCHKTGIYVVDISGVPTAVVVYLPTTVTTLRATYSTDGITWVDVDPIALGVSLPTGTATGWSSELLFNNTIYFLAVTGGNANDFVCRFNLGAASASAISLNAFYENAGSALVAWNGSIYMVRTDNALVTRLYDVTAGALSIAVQLDTSTVSQNVFPTKYTAFVDPTTGDLAVWYYRTTALGWKCVQIASGSFTIIDQTATVRPLALSGTTAGGNSPVTSGLFASVDEEGSPGVAAPVTLYYRAHQTPGLSLTHYQWNGFGAVMTLIGTGGNTAHALGIANRGGLGPLTWTASTLRVRPISWTGQGVSGGVRFSFKLYGPLGNEAVKVRAYRRTSPQPHTQFPSTLSGPSVGTISLDGFFNEGLVADNGVTTYTVVIALEADGVPNATPGAIVLDVVAV